MVLPRSIDQVTFKLTHTHMKGGTGTKTSKSLCDHVTSSGAFNASDCADLL